MKGWFVDNPTGQIRKKLYLMLDSCRKNRTLEMSGFYSHDGYGLRLVTSCYSLSPSSLLT